MPETVAVELASPAGEPLRIEWAAAALAAAGQASGEAGWRLEGELDPDAVDALRVVSAALPDRRGLALAALRPAGAAGHGEEVVAALLVAGGVAESVAEPLLSVESGADGLPRRLTLELHTGADAMPLRVAADVTAAARHREGGLDRVHAALEVRLDGKRSGGAYEVLAPAAAPNR